MPRSLPFSNRWRVVAIALVFVTSLCFAGLRAGAQKARPGQTGNNNAQATQKKSITPLRASETPEGSRITITSDGALNDYAAYRSGDRFYVLIPAADVPRVLGALRGRGFDDVKVQKRGNDILLSFRLLAGAAARVNQKFNKLEILITVPALAAANNTSSNTNARTQPSPSNVTGNTNVANTNTRTQVTPVNRNTGNPVGVTPSNNTANTNPNNATTNPNNATTNPNFNNNPSTGNPVGPDGATVQPDNSGFPPVTQTSPLVTPSATPPADQIAQLQPTPGIPTTNAPPVTTANAPAGSSLGATLKQNWLLLLLAAAIVGLIAWVLVARSKGSPSPVEERIESIRESRAEKIVEAAPAKAAVVAPVATKPLVAPVVTPPPVVESESAVAESEAGSAIEALPPVAVVLPPPVEVETEAKGIEPVAPVVEVEQASDEVTNLLAGHRYDEAIISTQNQAARQMIAAELLAALAGRNVVRHERARDAFIKHGYFDDATRTLRTAESPAERASSARSLGLVRHQESTPHLVAALEDDSPEVRRAAVESLAEVRDPAAVAPLEALRDREKDRRVPSALIQHAIEASVIGRAKTESPAETTAPIPNAYATTPLFEPPASVTTPLTAPEPAAEEVAEVTAEAEPPSIVEEAPAEALIAPPVEAIEAHDAEAVSVEELEQPALPLAESAIETVEAPEALTVEPPTVETAAPEAEAVAAPSFVEEEAAPQVETAMPPVVVEETSAVAEAPTVEEAAEVEEAAPVQLVETEAVEEGVAPQTQAEVVAPVPEETPAPVATAEPVVEYRDGTASEWVEVDVSAPEIASQAAPPPPMPVATVEEASATEAAPQAFVSEPLPPPTEAITEPLPEIPEPVVSESAAESVAPVVAIEPAVAAEEKSLDVATSSEKEIEAVEDELSSVPSAILRRLASEEANERAAAVSELGRIGGEDSFREISASFDDPSTEVRNAAARALFNLNPDRAASFTRALREAPPERRRHIGAALASSGLATEAIGHLMGESREKTYDAFSLLFLMSKAGEVQPLMRAVEEHPNNEVRLAVVKLLALSGQQEILPAFRRLAVRGSLPTEVRSAVMEAIYQISSQSPDTASRS